MNRNEFLKLLALTPLAMVSMKLNEFGLLARDMSLTEKMPVLFLGHGSPMNAIDENEFVAGFRNIAHKIQKPKAILCVSAHWETNGTFVTAMDNPRTIHDFGGFPKELYQVQYPAPGDPALAKETQSIISKANVELDDKWGLDHGAWSVIKHLYPNADVPVIQLSIDRTQNANYHYELAKEIASLRDKGILIIGSGNMVHNLGLVAWNRMKDDDYAFDWAKEAGQKMKDFILDGDHMRLVNYQNEGKAFELAIPTPEHYLPLIYTLGLQGKNEQVELFNDKAVAGSLTMTSIKIDKA
ncbi:MAG: 4,5-DOPA dioxygenase extradiol [Ignavibacteriae bacterium HGW-Ignavibacteriae-1]|nr:MAG: 4,5-DOPA dioxygenase extradiol [Ignavibacteriae bacterium HGW-Ignavibacteriae-1]